MWDKPSSVIPSRIARFLVLNKTVTNTGPREHTILIPADQLCIVMETSKGVFQHGSHAHTNGALQVSAG